VPILAPVSEAVYIIQVKRFPDTYEKNFVVLVSVLVLVAFTAFLFDRSAISERIDLTLGVYLGVIFFQIMMVERLPLAKHPSIMHTFMFLSSLTLMFLALFHVLIWLLNGLVTKEIRKREAVTRLRRSKRAHAAATMIQRAWRRRRILLVSRGETAAPKEPQRFAHVGNVVVSGRALMRRSLSSLSLSSLRQNGAHQKAGVVSSRDVPVTITSTSARAAEDDRGSSPMDSRAGGARSDDASTAPNAATAERPSSQLARRMRAGMVIQKRTAELEQQNYLAYAVLETATTLLAFMNWLLAFVAFAIYVISVLWNGFFAEGMLDAKCNNPWLLVDEKVSILNNLEEPW